MNLKRWDQQHMNGPPVYSSPARKCFMPRKLLLWTALLILGLPCRAQLPGSDQIIANLKYSIPGLRDAEITLGEIVASSFEGFHEGIVTVNARNTYRVLLAEDPPRLLILLGSPVDISLSEESVTELLEEEDRQMAVAAQDRHVALERFAQGTPARGADNAPVTIYEFSDFQCPYCARAADTMKELLARRAEDVRLVYLQLPLSIHNWAKAASVAAVCAADQDHDAFWMLHDRYFENQGGIVSATLLDQSREWLQEGASIDLETWESCAADTESAANQSAVLRVEVSVSTAERMGVTGTPAFFVNGHFLNGIQPIGAFEKLIDELIAGGAPDG